MKHSLSRFAAVVALALAAAAQSQADQFQYSYNWTGSPISISAGTGGVSFTSNDGGTTNGDTDTAATNVSVFSAASSESPDVIPIPVNGSNYTLAITISNGIAGATPGTISFTGLLQGQLTHDSSNLTNIITGVTDGYGTHTGQTFGSVLVGYLQYTVIYNGFAAPGPEAQHNQGAISFLIVFTPVEVAGGPTAPEPSSIVLGCLGLMFFGGIVYRVRRRKLELLSAAV